MLHVYVERFGVTGNLENFLVFRVNWPCLVPKKFCKIYQIPRHIKSLDTCMEY